MNETKKIACLAQPGPVTVYEASGRQELIDSPLIQVISKLLPSR